MNSVVRNWFFEFYIDVIIIIIITGQWVLICFICKSIATTGSFKLDALHALLYLPPVYVHGILSQKFVWPVGKSSIVGTRGTEGAACSAHEAIFNSTLFSCHPAAMGYPTGWVTHWTEEMPTRRDGGKAQAAPSAAGNHSSLCVDVLYWVTSILVA